MKAVVTGSAGFIGSHLVEELIDRGYLVTGIDRRSRLAGVSYTHLRIDLADHPSRTGLADRVADADVVFHLAARPGVRGGGSAVETMRNRDNVVATHNLLSVLPEATAIVATSSSSVYGGSAGGFASKEEDPLRPHGGYALSKVAMERICEERRARGGPVAVIRPFTVAGEGQRPDMAFSLWLDALRKGEPIRILGSGSRSRDITDIRDIVEGLIRAGEGRINDTVNLGTGVGHRLFDMARTLLDVAGLDREMVHEPVSAADVDATLADTSRCRRILGFVPVTDLRDLLERQVEAARRQSALVAT